MPLVPSLNEIQFHKYERTLESWCGCDKDAAKECDEKCIEGCSDDLDCCSCGCGCLSPSECYSQSQQ